MSSKSFWISDMTSKNDVLTSILMFFHQKSSCGRTLPDPPLPFAWLLLQITPAPEKSCRANVRSAVQRQSTLSSVSSPGPCRVWGRLVLSQAQSLALSKCTEDTTQFWADFQNYSALLYICQIPGKVNLHLVKARSKLNGLGSWRTSGPQFN
jgi:hypothetical protein